MRREGLVTRRPSRSARMWSPSQLQGLALWLDNSLITLNGANVSAWPDISGSGNHFTQANASLQPAYVSSEADFPVPQPAINPNATTERLVGPVMTGIVWIAAVANYSATTFANDAVLISSTVLANGYPLWGTSGGTAWRTGFNPAGTNTRYRDGLPSDTALTTANTPHLYEVILGTPWTSPGNVQIGTDVADLQWNDSIALIMMARSVPNAADRANFLAYIRGRGMIA